MASRITSPVVAYPSGHPLLAAVHHRPTLTFPLGPTSYLSLSSNYHFPKKVCNNGRRTIRDFSMNAQTMEQLPVTDGRMLVFVPPHPLIKHWVSILRNEQTPSPVFRSAMGELGRLLIYEASRDWLPTVTGEIQSPMGVASVEFVDPREPVAACRCILTICVLIVISYLSVCRLPEKFTDETRVIILDPMLATGGTIVAALDIIKKLGVDNSQIKVVCAVAAPPALRKLSENFQGIHVYAGIIDPDVNEKGQVISIFIEKSTT
uniref:uracil phosphoribosyltransferase n=1 Tax=Daucus carota subsp. sativus TaxID=79200 RepID=A0A161WXE4_DAUCS